MSAVEEYKYGADTALRAYVRTLANMIEFKYLGLILKATDDDWPSVVANLRKYRNKWTWLTQILVCDGEETHATVTF